jgi:hypothetical protein
MFAAATLITSDMFAKTISLTTSSIFTLGQNLIYSNTNYDISSLEKIEKQIDLLETVKIYDIWIQEIIEKQKDKINNSNALKEAIQSFMMMLNEIHDLLKSIENKIQLHGLKWFSSYRNLYVNDEVEQIKIKKNILDHRFNLIQQIYNFTS